MSWEYELLFDVDDMDGLTPLERQAAMDDDDRWKTEHSSLRKGRMGYRTRTTKAGPRLEAEIFPIFGKAQETVAREAKTRLTPEKIQKHNDERARRKLVQLMDANFGRDDLSLGLTYEGPAPSPERVEQDVKNFVERLRRFRKKNNMPELKYIYAVEWVEEGREKRPHCHFVTQGDVEEKTLKKIWGKKTGFCNCDRLQPGKEGLEAIARYIYNQNPGAPREKGRRKYSCSKNLIKPKTRTSDTKVTQAKVRKMASVFGQDPTESRRIMEKLYPGYEFVRATAKGSDIITDGIYIRVLMRKRGEG